MPAFYVRARHIAMFYSTTPGDMTLEGEAPCVLCAFTHPTPLRSYLFLCFAGIAVRILVTYTRYTRHVVVRTGTLLLYQIF